MTTPEAKSMCTDLLNLGNYIEGGKRSSQGDSISISKECPYLGAARIIDDNRQTCAEHTKRNLCKAESKAEEDAAYSTVPVKPPENAADEAVLQRCQSFAFMKHLAGLLRGNCQATLPQHAASL